MRGLGVLVPIAAIAAWALVAIAHAFSRMRVRELEIRERIAMIEKGLVPPPEQDPERFEWAMSRYDRPRGPGRLRHAGIIIMGVGLGLFVLISTTDHIRNGLGVGGFLMVLGLAFLVASLFERPSFPRDRLPSAPTSAGAPPPPSPSNPPS